MPDVRLKDEIFQKGQRCTVEPLKVVKKYDKEVPAGQIRRGIAGRPLGSGAASPEEERRNNRLLADDISSSGIRLAISSPFVETTSREHSPLIDLLLAFTQNLGLSVWNACAKVLSGISLVC